MPLPADTLVLPPGTLSAAHLTPDEAKRELAIHLYAQQRLSLGKARELAGMSLWPFRQLLASRGIGPPLTPQDVDDDITVLRALGRL